MYDDDVGRVKPSVPHLSRMVGICTAKTRGTCQNIWEQERVHENGEVGRKGKGQSY